MAPVHPTLASAAAAAVTKSRRSQSATFCTFQAVCAKGGGTGTTVFENGKCRVANSVGHENLLLIFKRNACADG